MSPRGPGTFLALMMLLGGAAPAQAPRAAIEPLLGGSRDSDGNLGMRAGLSLTVPAGLGATLGLEGWRWQVEDGFDRIRSYHGAARASFQPVPSITLDGAVGGTIVDLSGIAATETVFPTGRVRLRWKGPRGAVLDFRLRRGVLESSPDLMANLVTRTEAAATADVPLVPGLKLRGAGRAASLADRLDVNKRYSAAGMLVLAASSVEVSGQFHVASFDHFTTAGYFAPRLVQVLQLGSYGELEGATVTLAYDVGAGAQRFAEQGLPLGAWGRALSLWGQIAVSLTSVTQLRLELELYDSPAAAIAAAAGSGWKYGAGTISLRQSF